MERQIASDNLEPQEQPRIYVLPTYEKPAQNDLKILVLTDGNNRAMGLNQGYGEGGKNVVKIAQYLAQRGDVSKLVACIMSNDNATKRSEDFFMKMYQAFVGLGVKMDTENALLKDNIKMSAYGDLDVLRKHSSATRRFVEVVENVCSKTDHLQKPRLNLVLGINYDENIALEHDVQAIYRSGMEQPEAVRLSGIRSHRNINNIGSTTLWPHVCTAEIGGMVDQVKENLRATLGLGYSPEQIVQIIENGCGHLVLHPKLVIPYTGNSAHLLQVISNYCDSPEALPFSIKIFDKNDQQIGLFGNPDQDLIFELKPASLIMFSRDQQADFDIFLAPGQQKSGFLILPERPEIKYASVLPCLPSPEGIISGVHQSIDFVLKNERLKGSERRILMDPFEEFRNYLKLGEILEANSELSLEQLAHRLLSSQNKEVSDEEFYNQLADLFAAKMLVWAKSLGVQLTNLFQLRAFINYDFSSFNLCYFPNHPQWENDLRKYWEKRALFLGRYMNLTSLMDDTVYDDHQDSQARQKILPTVTPALQSAVRLDAECLSCLSPTLPNYELIKIIIGEFFKLAKDLQADSNSDYFRNWQQGMNDLIQCMDDEWNQDVVNNPIFKDSSDPRLLIEKIEQAYLHRADVPEFIKQKIREAAEKFQSGDESAKSDLQLYCYLIDIEKSIGAGLTYKALLCVNSKDLPTNPDLMRDLDEISALMNIYFRMANDLAEFSRNNSDRDQNISSYDFIKQKYSAENQQLQSIQFMMILITELKQKLYQQIDRFQQQYQGAFETSMSVSLQRSRIGELFYKGTHYREAKRDQVKEFFRQMSNCGIDAS